MPASPRSTRSSWRTASRPSSFRQVRESVDALRAELRAVLSEIAEVRETVEPLQGPAERVARLSEKLPGGD